MVERVPVVEDSPLLLGYGGQDHPGEGPEEGGQAVDGEADVGEGRVEDPCQEWLQVDPADGDHQAEQDPDEEAGPGLEPGGGDGPGGDPARQEGALQHLEHQRHLLDTGVSHQPPSCRGD